MTAKYFVAGCLALAAFHAGVATSQAEPAESAAKNMAVSSADALKAPSKVKVETLLLGRGVLWGFDFLPDGRIVMTERSGNLLIFDPKTKGIQAISGLPKVRAAGQGGLLDVRVHPDFARNQTIFFTYSQSTENGATTALAKGVLKGDALTFLPLLAARDPNGNSIHYGSRIEWGENGEVFLSVGDRNERHKAQQLDSHLGKILRLTQDGKAAPGNPFADRQGALAEIYSYGHRNPQGLARHPTTGALWSTEFGPRGGDELNLIRAGSNYGWPIVTYGREYYGPRIGEGTSKPGIVDPVAHWVPSISPSALAIYDGAAFPAWKHNFFLANLSGQTLLRLVIDGDKVVHQEALLETLHERFRNVRTGPDGYLYLSTDGGKLLRLVPG